MRDRKDESHRRQTERELGRKLGRDEIVHHKNEDKTDNRPSNREVVSRADHTANHNRGRSLSKLRAALRMVREKKALY